MPALPPVKSPNRWPPERLHSLDVFRGATIAAMVVVNNPGAAAETYPFLRHAAWNGWTFADTIFPAFLWIVGVALTLSTGKRARNAETRGAMFRHAARRSAALFGLGVLVDAIVFPHRQFPFVAFGDHLHLTGVLQKIAVCYLVAWAIHAWAGWRGAALGTVVLNLVYLGLLFLYPVPGCGAGQLTVQCNFPGYLDRAVLAGHLWGAATQDPDGLGAILPAISTVLLGVLAGQLLRSGTAPGLRMYVLGGMGLALVAAAASLSPWIPVNKPLWTTTYAFLMTGFASICFAACYWMVDIRKWGRWFTPLEILGVNALAAYVISRLASNLPKIHVVGKSLYTDVCRQLVDPPAASLLYALIYLTGVYVVVWFMYRRRWLLKV